MNKVTVIGIDPGKSGGIAAIYADGSYDAFPIPPSERDLWDLLIEITADAPVVHAYLEKVSSSPGSGVVSAFSFGRSLGCLHMAVIALECRLEWVTPQKWQREFGLIVQGKGLGQAKTDKKNRNKVRAQELFPDAKITHAIADALLIAEYGRRNSNPGA